MIVKLKIKFYCFLSIEDIATEATSLDWKISSVWQIPVFPYGLLMRN
jgi:hypothetical protein